MRCYPHVVRLSTVESWLAAFTPFSSWKNCPIMKNRDPRSLNKRSELMNSCLHKKSWLLTWVKDRWQEVTRCQGDKGCNWRERKNGGKAASQDSAVDSLTTWGQHLTETIVAGRTIFLFCFFLSFFFFFFIKSVKMKILKNKKMLFSHVTRITQPKN